MGLALELGPRAGRRENTLRHSWNQIAGLVSNPLEIEGEPDHDILLTSQSSQNLRERERWVEPLHDLQRKGGEGATGGVKDETNVGYACPTYLKHHPYRGETQSPQENPCTTKVQTIGIPLCHGSSRPAHRDLQREEAGQQRV